MRQNDLATFFPFPEYAGWLLKGEYLMNKIDWYGLIAAIIAASLGLTLLIGVTGGVWAGRPLGEKGAEVVVGIFTILGAALTAYFAMRKNEPEKPKDEEKPK